MLQLGKLIGASAYLKKFAISTSYGTEHMAKKRAVGKARLIVGAHLSDYQIKKIIRFFAERRSGVEAASLSKVSLNTIYKIYMLLRLRMVKLGWYETFDKYLEARESDLTLEYFHITGDGDEFIYGGMERRKLRRSEFSTRFLHMAQLTSDFGRKLNPAQEYRDILLIIKYTGPLNRSPVRTARYERFLREWAENATLAGRRRMKAINSRKYKDNGLGGDDPPHEFFPLREEHTSYLSHRPKERHRRRARSAGGISRRSTK